MAPPMATVAHDHAGVSEEDVDALVARRFAQQPVQHRVPERKLRPAVADRLGEEGGTARRTR